MSLPGWTGWRDDEPPTAPAVDVQIRDGDIMSATRDPNGAATGNRDDTGLAGRGDSPKRHGDKLASGADPQVTPPQNGPSGDSPKPHGEKLGQVLAEASKE